MPPTPNEPRRSSLFLAKIVLGISALGVLPLPIYWLVDYGTDGVIRSVVKRFVDQNFLLYAAVVAPSSLAFVLCTIYLVMQWASPSKMAASSHRHALRWVIRVVCWILLVAIGVYVGGCVPLWCLLIQQGSIRETMLSAAIVLAVIVVGAALLCPRHHRPWVVPLACGVLIGEIILLAQAAWDGWNVDVTL